MSQKEYFFVSTPGGNIFVSRFGASSRKLTRTSAALLCYPFGQEYMRAHRAFRQLAMLLSRKGCDVYRFDYPGTGDSFGEAAGTSYAALLSGSRCVLDHIVGSTSYESIAVIGLRFGALVAAALAADEQVTSLCLWDPFQSGKHFLEELEAEAGVSGALGIDLEIHGYPLPSALRKELIAIDYSEGKRDSKLQVSQFLSADTPWLADVIAAQLGSGVNEQVVPCLGDWNFVDDEGSLLIPTDIIRAIADAHAAQDA